MPNQITLNFTPCSPAPDNGYRVRFRPVGTTPYYIVTPNFFTSPAVFTDDQSGAADGVEYEGFIEGDCGDGVFGGSVPWATVPASFCEGAGFPVGTTYAALFFSGATEDHSIDTTCEGNPVHLEVIHRAVFIAFFSDAALTTPLILPLNAYPIVVGGSPYNIGDGSDQIAWFVDFFPFTNQQFTGPGCDTEVATSNLPALNSNICFTEIVDPLVEDGDFTIERGAGDSTTNAYNADMRESVTGYSGFGTPPGAGVGVGAAGPVTVSGYPSTSRITISGGGIGTVTITIVGTATDGTTGESFSGNFLLGDLYSTKTYYFDVNNPITVTVDEA